jgi:hypothetical protein
MILFDFVHVMMLLFTSASWQHRGSVLEISTRSSQHGNNCMQKSRMDI